MKLLKLFSFTKLNLNVISLFLSFIFTLILMSFISSFNKVSFNTKIGRYYENTNELSIHKLLENSNLSNSSSEESQTNGENQMNLEDQFSFENSIIADRSNDGSNNTSNNTSNSNGLNGEWKIEIPKIDLIANISEGTSKELLDEYVGHFETTGKENGNIGLAAHNRGYKVNYFGRIKELIIGDEIYYTYGSINKKYKVTLITIIKDTEWTYLENTSDNRITLITCLEDEPEYRRCIQGIEFN